MNHIRPGNKLQHTIGQSGYDADFRTIPVTDQTINMEKRVMDPPLGRLGSLITVAMTVARAMATPE